MSRELPAADIAEGRRLIKAQPSDPVAAYEWMRKNGTALLDAAEKLDWVHAVLAHVRPICRLYPEGDPVSCGWKRAVADIQAAIKGDVSDS